MVSHPQMPPEHNKLIRRKLHVDSIRVVSGTTRWSFFYLVYVNDPIHAIQFGSPNTGILNIRIPSSCPSLADDLSLIGIFPLALQIVTYCIQLSLQVAIYIQCVEIMCFLFRA